MRGWGGVGGITVFRPYFATCTVTAILHNTVRCCHDNVGVWSIAGGMCVIHTPPIAFRFIKDQDDYWI